MEILCKYGVAVHIYLPIVKRGAVDFAVGADWTPAAGDVKISKDGGAAANVTNLPTAIAMGNTAMWDFSLTATEVQAAKIMVSVADSATKAVEDQFFIIATYGNASAQHAVDLDDSVRAGLTALPNAAAEAAGGLFTRGSGAGQINQDANGRVDTRWVAGNVTVGTNNDKTGYGLSAAAVQAIWDALTSALTTVGSIGKLLVDNINATISSRLAPTVAGRTLDVTVTGEAGIDLDNTIGALAKGTEITGFNDLSAADVRAAVGLAAANLDAQLAAIVGYIDTEVASILAAVDTEVAAILALLDDPRGEPGQGAAPVNPDMATKVDYLYKAWRNRSTQTANDYKLYGDDALTVDQKAATSDDGTTFDRGEIAAGP